MLVDKQERFGKFNRIKLLNNETGEFVAFVPEFGGNVNELVLNKNGKNYSIIDGFLSDEEMVQNKFMKSGRLIPFPNRILDGTYVFNGIRYQLPINEPAHHNAIHGFFYNQPLMLTDIHTKNGEISAQLRFDYTGNYPGYPFKFSAILTYTLTDAQEFKIHLSVKNIDKQPLPFGDGWHPYFKLGKTADDLYLQLPTSEKMVLTDRMVPDGKTETDNRFLKSFPIKGISLDSVFKLPINEGVAVAELSRPEEDVTIQVWQETGDRKYNFMVVFIPPGRASVAIEPMTCATNAFNNMNGLIVLQPGEMFETSHGVKLI